MSASAVRIEANRNNAQFSTGPRTAEGKQHSAMNAVRHGLTSAAAFLPNEDPQAYQEFCRELIDDLRPKGALELQLARAMADTQWRLNRCRSIEQVLLAAEPDRGNEPDAIARFQRDQVESLNKFSMYEQRLTRNFQATLKQFRELQAGRLHREEQDLQAAAKILKHCQSKQIPYDPAADGFVFSTAEIEAWMRRRDHLDEVQPANNTGITRRAFNRGMPETNGSAHPAAATL